MVKNGKDSVEHLHSFAAGTKFLREFNNVFVGVAAKSNSVFRVGDKTKDACFHRSSFHCAVDGMDALTGA